MQRQPWGQRIRNTLGRLVWEFLPGLFPGARTLSRTLRLKLSKLKHWLGSRRQRSPKSQSSGPAFSNGRSPKRVEQLECPSQVEAVPKILEWLEALNLELTAAVLWECRIILVEGFTNAVCHAHQGHPEARSVDLKIEMWADWLEIQIWDRGDPFDLPAMLEAMRRQNESEPLRYGSGRGLLLMKLVSDHLSYERRGDRNCLVARKRLNQRG